MITRRKKLEDELKRLEVKNEHLRQERAKRRHAGLPPVVTIDSDGERDDAVPENVEAKRPRQGGEEEAGPSDFVLPIPNADSVGEEPLVQAQPFLLQQKLLEVKQEADALPRRKKKKKKRWDRTTAALAAATTEMDELKRQIE